MKTDKDATEQINIRMPVKMKEQLQRIADADMRSLSNLILFICNRHLENYPPAPASDKKKKA